ncbi:MAG: HlyD family efflux transporter periplasmic adaptor subunit [Proteobacteria bacterium]|nr:HlyD family efflux transporter periplasmic adaptor subunit [Pseudomonadota bacterium]
MPKNPKHMRLMLAGPATILLVGGYLYLDGDRYISTDNAYVKTDKVSIAAEISGKTLDVEAKDNTHVEKGTVLFHIDPEPFQIAVSQAEAQLANIRTEIESLRADYKQKQAEVAKTEDSIKYWKRENDRHQALLKAHTVAASQADEIFHNLQNAQKEHDAARFALAATLAQLDNNPDIATEEHPRYKVALAELEKARLNLKRTEVVAPYSGTTANVKMQPGEYVAAGVPLFSIVADNTAWVEANFKETDLTHMVAGQDAEIEIDTYGGTSWPAKVVSITPATGAEFSVLPPQNATGNWVKVVQRVMVRLEFDKNQPLPPLAAGMSANITVDTNHTRMARWFGAKS